MTIDGKKEALEREIKLSWEQTRTVSFWSIRANPNLKQNALKDYKDLMRFDWEESKIDEVSDFMVFHQYSDEPTMRLVAAVAKVAGRK